MNRLPRFRLLDHVSLFDLSGVVVALVVMSGMPATCAATMWSAIMVVVVTNDRQREEELVAFRPAVLPTASVFNPTGRFVSTNGRITHSIRRLARKDLHDVP